MFLGNNNTITSYNWFGSIIAIQRWLLYILPFALVSGPFFSDLFIILIAIIFLYITIKQKQWNYYKHPLILVFWIWCLYLIAISLLSENPYLSLESSLFYFRFGFFAIAVWQMLDTQKFIIKNFAISLGSVFVILIIDGYIQFIFGKNIFGNSYDGYKLSGLFGEEAVLGSFLSRTMPLLFALMSYIYSKSKSKSLMFFSLAILISSDILIYLSGERTAFFYLLLSTLIILININIWKRERIITFFLSLIIIFLITITDEFTKRRMIMDTFSQIFINQNKQEVDGRSYGDTKVLSNEDTLNITNKLTGNSMRIFSIEHQVIYESAIKIFIDHPVFGVGPKMFREVCKKPDYQFKIKHDKTIILNGCQTHPHNTYIQLLAETGIIGTLPFIIAFVVICFLYLRHFLAMFNINKSKISDFQVCLYAAILITLWPLVPTGNVFHNWTNVIYFLPVGFLMHSYKKLY